MKILKATLVLMLALAVLVLAVIVGIGWYLAPQDKLVKSDAIIVVSGGDTNKRTDEGVKLWKGGWAPTLILVGAAADKGTSNAAVMRLRAVSEGVPAEHTLIEERSANTLENAQYLKPILESKNIRSGILVSSPYHTRRVKTTFHKVYGKDYHFIAHPALDSVWARSSWWKRQSTINLTLDELQKTLYVKFLQK